MLEEREFDYYSARDYYEKGVEEGLHQLEKAGMEDLVKVIYLPDLHESIAGLVAGKIKEQIYRPVLVVTKGEEGLKGSARSIESYMMVDELSKVRQNDLVLSLQTVR